jgi:uncharacterized protein (DUF885 family)
MSIKPSTKPFFVTSCVLVAALSISGCAQNSQVSPNLANIANDNANANVTASIKQNTNVSAFDELIEEIYRYEGSQFPGTARAQGTKTIDLARQFTDISKSALIKRNAQFVAYRQALDNIDASALDDSRRITLLMQKYRLDNYISYYQFNEYRVPITSEFGFHSSLGSRLSNMLIRSSDDAIVYQRMLSELAEQFEINTAYMREGISVGHTQPQVVLQGYESTITAYIVDDVSDDTIKTHPFFKPIANAAPDVIDAKSMIALTDLVKSANQTYQDFYTFFTQEYVPNAKTDIAAKNWPNGEAFYSNRTKHYTTTDLNAKDIHEIGLQEVARIRAEMQGIVDSLIEKGEFSGDINAFIEFLRTDPRFYAKTPDELIQYASYVSKKMDAKLPQLFYKMPRTPYGVAPVPDAIAPKYTTGRYLSPRSDDQPGYYWVNTYALDKRPLYAIPALTLHEAVPGHHLQISLAAEMEDLPAVRRSTYISAFGEGWGLYSEFLGLEVGMYEDPYDNFGRLSYEMCRACRLVVDTGMHMFGWSRQQALDYMLENTALSEHNVRTEIDRYISWPAQALSYKIGEIKIKELRATAERELGDKFDLRAFHDAILANGSIPLFVLEQKMMAFIDAEKEK